VIGKGTALASGGELADAVASLRGDSPLRDSCHYVVSTPGKRFRSAVLVDAARYGNRATDRLVEQAAVAIELFHSATLAHDDVVDNGQLRRGKLAVGTHAGNLAASLTGGWLFARAVELIADLGDEASIRFAETASTVCEGEMLETEDLHDVDRTHERYLTVIGAKTASLIAFAAWLGAKAGGAEQGRASELERYGEAMGMAFQISDDILDLVADPESTGKTPGSDLRQGVYTLPVIYALDADQSIREALLRGPEEHELPALVERIRRTGALEAAFADCTNWIEEAHSSLPGIEPCPDHEQRLASLASSVLGRAAEMTQS
jgi:heptaprenyl diphosphate synthase